MGKTNIEKTPPKGDIKFSITLSEEQKRAKELIISKPYSFLIGFAGSGKTLVAVQIALDLYFKRKVNKISVQSSFFQKSIREKLERFKTINFF